jgi:hypothetical protein
MAQVNKISSFKSFTEVKNQEATMKLREENNAKRQETVGKIGAILDEMGLTSLSELDEKKKQALINKMFGNVSEDEAEDIEDELNKLGKPKKLEEGNAFIFAAGKAKQEGKTEFEFNGKKYKVTLKKDTGLKEGNDSGNAKESGEDEFEFGGETYEIEESKRTTFTGKTAHDLYTQTGGKPVTVFVKNDWYSVDPKELKDNKGDSFTGYSKDGSDYGFDLKDIKFIQESVVNEARSISKIQYDWSKLTTSMQATAQNWKAAEGPAKESLLGKLKEMTAQKKALEAELDAAIADKDKDLELVVTESTISEGSFYRLPKDVIGTELYTANQNMQSFYSRIAAGNDVDPKDIDSIIKLLQQVKSLTKKFNKADEVIGTVYEAEVNEAQNFKSTKDFLDFLEEIDGMPEHRIKRIMGKDYIDTPGGFRDEADDYDNDIEDYTRSNIGSKDFEKLKTWWENNVAESAVVEGGFNRSSPSAEATHKAEQLKKLKKLRDHKEEQDRIKKAQLKRAKAASNESEVTEGKEMYKISIDTEVEDSKIGNKFYNVRKGEKVELVDDDGDIATVKLKSGEIVNIESKYIIESIEVNEAEVQSDDEFKEYAMTVLKKAFGDDFDEAKAGEVVDGILKKCGDDYGAAVGMLTASLGE